MPEDPEGHRPEKNSPEDTMTPFNIIKALIGCGDLGVQVQFSHVIVHAPRVRIQGNGANP